MHRLGDHLPARSDLLAMIIGRFQQFSGFLGRDRGGFDGIFRPDRMQLLRPVDLGHDEPEYGFNFHVFPAPLRL